MQFASEASVIATPLGFPVDPDVNPRYAIAVWKTWGVCSPVGTACMLPAKLQDSIHSGFDWEIIACNRLFGWLISNNRKTAFRCIMAKIDAIISMDRCMETATTVFAFTPAWSRSCDMDIHLSYSSRYVKSRFWNTTAILSGYVLQVVSKESKGEITPYLPVEKFEMVFFILG